jgi:hypothetical protein
LLGHPEHGEDRLVQGLRAVVDIALDDGRPVFGMAAALDALDRV